MRLNYLNGGTKRTGELKQLRNPKYVPQIEQNSEMKQYRV